MKIAIAPPHPYPGGVLIASGVGALHVGTVMVKKNLEKGGQGLLIPVAHVDAP